MSFHLLLIDEDFAFTKASGFSLQKHLEREADLLAEGWKVWTVNSWDQLVAFPRKPQLLLCGRLEELTSDRQGNFPVSTADRADDLLEPGLGDRGTQSEKTLMAEGAVDPDVCRVVQTEEDEAGEADRTSSTDSRVSEVRDALSTDRLERSDSFDSEISDGYDPDRSDAGFVDRIASVRRLLQPGEVFDLTLLSTLSCCARHYPEAAVAALIDPDRATTDDFEGQETSGRDMGRKDPPPSQTMASQDLACAKIGAWATLRRDQPVSAWIEPLRRLSALRSSRRRIVGPLGSHRRTDALDVDLSQWIGGFSDVAERIYSVAPLRERLGDQFSVLVDRYISVVHASREARIVDSELHLGDRVLEISRELFVYYGGSRDVIAIHREATQRISETIRHRSKRAGLLMESRLILTAVLGRLLSFYRTSSASRSSSDRSRN